MSTRSRASLAHGSSSPLREVDERPSGKWQGAVRVFSCSSVGASSCSSDLVGRPVALSTSWADWDEVDNWDRADDYALGETGEDLIAGGGFQIEKP